MEQDTRKRFEAICPECGETVYVCKSLGMELGFLDKGVGTCAKCRKMIGLKFDFEKQEMSTERLRKPDEIIQKRCADMEKPNTPPANNRDCD